MSHKFQIDLRGIIDLLSHHLYSGPQVFVRELLQNAVDALRAREKLQPGHPGAVTLELLAAKGPPTLLVADNGIGLTEAEVHQFLATIGASSKRGDGLDRPTDFLGQFGIGLLSGFLVADEIVVVSRSAREEAPAVEWRGRADGTYRVKALNHDLAPGTQVYLTARPGREEFFTPGRVAELAALYGGLLPYPVHLVAGKDRRAINADGAPWRQRYPNPAARTRALLDYGQKAFGTPFLDAIPLRAEPGDVDGVAFVLPYAPSLAQRGTHRVYLKNMLLAEAVDNLLPPWAFFVKCVLNANGLRPVASREALAEDETLTAARDALGQNLRGYLVELAEHHPERLRKLLAMHDLTLKALALEDDDFYRLIVNHFTFETSLGDMTLGEYRREHGAVRFVADVDQFRQIARVAAAQGLCVVNGGYVYGRELLAKLPTAFPEAEVEQVDPAGLAQGFEDLTLAEREAAFELVRAADLALQPFRCGADVKKFAPADLPALYSTGKDAAFLRSVEQSREVANPLWAGVLEGLTAGKGAGPYARLCFNYTNPLVRRLTTVRDRRRLQRAVELLYVQALLLGHHPLSARELSLLNDGLLDLIGWGLGEAEGGTP